MGTTNFTFYIDKRKKKMVVASRAFFISNSESIYEYIQSGFNITCDLYPFLMLIKKILFLIFCLSLVISAEGISYLILPYSKLDTLESILRILEEDSILFWRQRPHLNTKFQGVNVATNSLGLRSKEFSIEKDNQAYRIICLGASPTFGWGVDFQNIYPFLLEQKLKKSNLSEKIEVINAAQIGYTTYQGVILLEKYLLKYSPDLITISYILNDIDRYRFYRNEGLSDKELPTRNSLMIKLNNILAKSRLYLLLKRGISCLVYKNDKLATITLRRQSNLSKIRVSKEDYKANLEKFISICKTHNIRLLFIKLPINLSLPSLSADENNIIKNGYKLSTFYYDLGCRYANMEEYQKARNFFKKAKDYLVFECCRDGIIYQHLMEEIAHKYNIPLIDVASIFITEGKTQNLFNGVDDPIHPNTQGHELIAKAIYEMILEYNLLSD